MVRSNSLGVRLRGSRCAIAEKTPFEPDPGHAGAGKRSTGLIDLFFRSVHPYSRLTRSSRNVNGRIWACQPFSMSNSVQTTI
jgi:hypothetical protein